VRSNLQIQYARKKQREARAEVEAEVEAYKKECAQVLDSLVIINRSEFLEEDIIKKGLEVASQFINKHDNLEEKSPYCIDSYVTLYDLYLYTLLRLLSEIKEFKVIEAKKEMVVRCLKNKKAPIKTTIDLCDTFVLYSYYKQETDLLVIVHQVYINCILQLKEDREKQSCLTKIMRLYVNYISFKLNYFFADEVESWEQFIDEDNDNTKGDFARLFEFIVEKYFHEPRQNKQWESMILAYDVVIEMIEKFNLVTNKDAFALNEESLNTFKEKILTYRDVAMIGQKKETQEELEERISNPALYQDKNTREKIRRMSSHLNHELPYLESKIDVDSVKKHMEKSIQLYYELLMAYIQLQGEIDTEVKALEKSVDRFDGDKMLDKVMYAKFMVSNQMDFYLKKILSCQYGEPIAIEYYKGLSLIYITTFNMAYRTKLTEDWHTIRQTLCDAAQLLKKIEINEYSYTDELSMTIIDCISAYLCSLCYIDINILNIGIAKYKMFYDELKKVRGDYFIQPLTWQENLANFSDKLFLIMIDDNESLNNIQKQIALLLPDHPFSQTIFDQLNAKSKEAGQIEELNKRIAEKKRNLNKKINEMECKLEEYKKNNKIIEENSNIVNEDMLATGFEPNQIPQHMIEQFKTLKKYYDNYTQRIRQIKRVNIEDYNEKIQSLKKMTNEENITTVFNTIDEKIYSLSEFEKNHYNITATDISAVKLLEKACIELSELLNCHDKIIIRVNHFLELKKDILSKLKANAEKQKIKNQLEEQKLKIKEKEEKAKKAKIAKQEKVKQKKQEKDARIIGEQIKIEDEKRKQQDEILLKGAGNCIVPENLDYGYYLHQTSMQNISDEEMKDNVGMHYKGGWALRCLIYKLCSNPENAKKLRISDVDPHCFYNEKFNVKEFIEREKLAIVGKSNEESLNQYINAIKADDEKHIIYDITFETAPGYQFNVISPIHCHAKHATANEFYDPERDCLQVDKYYYELIIPTEYREIIIKMCNGEAFYLFPPFHKNHPDYAYVAHKLYFKLKNVFPFLPSNSEDDPHLNLISYDKSIELLSAYYYDCLSEDKTSCYTDLTKFYGQEISQDEVPYVKLIFKQFYSGYLKSLNQDISGVAEKCADEYFKYITSKLNKINYNTKDKLIQRIQRIASEQISISVHVNSPVGFFVEPSAKRQSKQNVPQKKFRCHKRQEPLSLFQSQECQTAVKISQSEIKTNNNEQSSAPFSLINKEPTTVVCKK